MVNVDRGELGIPNAGIADGEGALFGLDERMEMRGAAPISEGHVLGQVQAEESRHALRVRRHAGDGHTPVVDLDRIDPLAAMPAEVIARERSTEGTGRGDDPLGDLPLVVDITALCGDRLE